MGGPIQPALPLRTGDGGHPPLLMVDGHNLLWSATFGFPAVIYSRDRTRTLTGLFAFFALLRKAIRDDLPEELEVVVAFDGEHGAAVRKQDHDGYKASRPANAQAMLPLQFLPDVKRGLEICGIRWVELAAAEADDVIATLAAATSPQPVVIMSRDRDFYQLVTDRVVVLNTRFRAGRKLVTPADVYQRHRRPATGRRDHLR